MQGLLKVYDSHISPKIVELDKQRVTGLDNINRKKAVERIELDAKKAHSTYDVDQDLVRFLFVHKIQAVCKVPKYFSSNTSFHMI